MLVYRAMIYVTQCNATGIARLHRIITSRHRDTMSKGRRHELDNELARRGQGRPRSPVTDQLILDAARKMLATGGFDALNFEALAQAAGVSRPTIYRRWPTKALLVNEIAHGGDTEQNLMFAGHAAFRFKKDPFYSNGFVPTVKQLVDRILTGD